MKQENKTWIGGTELLYEISELSSVVVKATRCLFIAQH
jgi:hypothetical protein